MVSKIKIELNEARRNFLNFVLLAFYSKPKTHFSSVSVECFIKTEEK